MEGPLLRAAAPRLSTHWHNRNRCANRGAHLLLTTYFEKSVSLYRNDKVWSQSLKHMIRYHEDSHDMLITQNSSPSMTPNR